MPPWFLDDENKHYKTNLPVTKEAITALRAKLRALDARPIKKIAEAKARKKMRAVQKLDKAMKKAEGVVEASDMTERAKASQVEKLMRKGMSTKKTNDVKVVVAKGAHRGVQGRPKGVKGRYLMVDSRMKKEVSHCDIVSLDYGSCVHSSEPKNGKRRRTRSGSARRPVCSVLYLDCLIYIIMRCRMHLIYLSA